MLRDEKKIIRAVLQLFWRWLQAATWSPLFPCLYVIVEIWLVEKDQVKWELPQSILLVFRSLDAKCIIECKTLFPKWRQVPISTISRYIFNYKARFKDRKAHRDSNSNQSKFPLSLFDFHCSKRLHLHLNAKFFNIAAKDWVVEDGWGRRWRVDECGNLLRYKIFFRYVVNESSAFDDKWKLAYTLWTLSISLQSRST